MASKNLKIGAIWMNEVEVNGEKQLLPSIKLGTKSPKSEYNFTVELVVKDGDGNVVGTSTNGYIKMFAVEKGPKTPPNLRFDLVIPRS